MPDKTVNPPPVDAQLSAALADISIAVSYPQEYEERIEFLGREILLRPIRPEDELQHARFLAAVDPGDVQFRFFHAVRVFDHAQLERFTHIDYDREMAFIATVADAEGDERVLGVVRVVRDEESTRGEFAILVRSDLKHQGLGGVLMDKIVRYCRARGMSEIFGDVLTTNHAMLALMHKIGFHRVASEDSGVARVSLALPGGSAALR